MQFGQKQTTFWIILMPSKIPKLLSNYVFTPPVVLSNL